MHTADFPPHSWRAGPSRPSTERDWYIRRCVVSVLHVSTLSDIVAVYAQEFQGLRYDALHPDQMQSDQRAHQWMQRGPLPIQDICKLVFGYTNTLSNTRRIPGRALHGCSCMSCMMPDGRVAYASWDGVYVWDGVSETLLVAGYTCTVSSIAAFPGTFKVVIGTSEGSVIVCHESGVTLRLTTTSTYNFKGWVTKLVVLPNGRLVAGATSNEIRVYDVDRNICLWDWRGAFIATVNAIVPVESPGGLSDGAFAFASGDDNVYLCDGDYHCLQTLAGHMDAVTVLAVLHDGKLASGSQDKTVRVWDRGLCVQRLDGHVSSVIALAALAGDRLASASFDHPVRVWHVSTGVCLFELVQTRPVRTLVSLPDGQLAGGSDEIVQVWNVDDGKCTHLLKAHVGPLLHLSCLPGGQLLWGTTATQFSTWV